MTQEQLKAQAPKGYQKLKADGSHSGHNERIWFSPHCLVPDQNAIKSEGDLLSAA
jgi:hypothetical protein